MNAKQKLTQWMWFGGGVVLGLSALSMSQAAPFKIKDDTALYQSLSDIRVQRQAELKTGHEVSRLAALESQYREDLPIARKSLRKHPRLKKVVQRVSQKRYLP